MPGGAVRAEVPEQSGVEQGRGLGSVPDVGQLPGCSGRAAYPSGRDSPAPASRAVICCAGTGRPRSVHAESAARTVGATAIQCSGKEPRNSGE